MIHQLNGLQWNVLVIGGGDGGEKWKDEMVGQMGFKWPGGTD